MTFWNPQSTARASRITNIPVTMENSQVEKNMENEIVIEGFEGLITLIMVPDSL